MDQAAYRSLSPRERDCLRLVAQGLTSKQIAARLSAPSADDGAGPARGLTPLTVDGYLKSAIRKLDVPDRKAAARLVAAHEGAHPQWLGDPIVGGRPSAPHPPPADAAPGRGRTAFRLPVRRRGEVNNELGLAVRLLWIPAITVALAIGFGMLTVGLKVIADLAWPGHVTR